MSTYLYLQCLDHDPPLTSDDESGQHLYDLPQIQADIADRDRLVAVFNEDGEGDWWGDRFDSHFRRNSVRFLAAHPRCALAIIDEYGRRHPNVEPQP